MKKIIHLYKDFGFPFLLVILTVGSLFVTKEISIFIALLVIVWFFSFKNYRSLKKNKKWLWPYLVYLLIFILGFIFSPDKRIGGRVLERQLSFIILPTIIFSKKWTKQELIFWSKFYVIAITAIAVFSILNLGFFFVRNQEFVSTMNDSYLQWKLPHLTGFHPTYFGLLVVIATLILLTSIRISTRLFMDEKFYLSILLTCYLLYLSARTAVICQLILWAWFLYSFLIKKLKFTNTRKVLSIFFIIISLCLFLFSSNYLLDKFLRVTSDGRFLLWESAYRIIKDNYFVLGEGLGGQYLAVKKYIIENNLTQFNNPDLHNQFLMNYVDLGILGLLALLLLLYRPLLILKNRTLILFSVICTISFLTESVLFVIKGIVIFIIMSCFFVLKTLENEH